MCESQQLATGILYAWYPLQIWGMKNKTIAFSIYPESSKEWAFMHSLALLVELIVCCIQRQNEQQ